MSSNSSHVGERLAKYRAKRSASRTPEPFGGEAERPHLFVVQKHDATRMHYDFRLELGGVLVSWAVPKGPSADPKEKRLAVHVEDHPVEYADFEGVIPDDNYGAGPVIVWDRGTWAPVGDPVEGLKRGKLVFQLRGFKLHGEWTLVRTKTKGEGPSKDWLLIKHKDGFASASTVYPEESILSGLTVEEMGAGSERAQALLAEVAKSGVPERKLALGSVAPMLAELGDAPFSRAGWLFELKYDGFRLLAAREAGRAQLAYRRGLDATRLYPDLAQAILSLPCESAILDGEVVVLDDEGRPSFQRLQKRAMLDRASDIQRASIELPAVLFCFDLLALDGYDLRGLPLLRRKELLQRLLPKVGPLRYADHILTRGEEMYRAAVALGLEGVMAKRADSTYRAGRSRDWIKLRHERSGDFVIVGYTAPKRGRVGLGALHLGAFDGEKLVYVGRVGSGMDDRQLARARDALDAARRDTPPFDGPLPDGGPHTWSEPRLVCEVRFKEWTEDHLLRQPVFLRFRDDKRPEECELPARARAAPAPPPRVVEATERTVPFTNLDKVFWPDEGYTKGELIEFYRACAPWLLHYLRDRPVVMTRYPDGITGKSFFQKDAPGFAPSWLRTERMWSEHANREIDYFIIDDEPSLLYVINLGTIPLHVWASRVKTLERPDWCILDLDPKGAPFSHVIEVAKTVRELCEEIELPAYPKTSGQAGLHVLIPLGRLCTFDQARTIGELLARVVVARRPELCTIERVVSARGGKVYVDYLQNGHGKLIAAPLAARPVPGALVSTPLHWREVSAKLDPKRFTIATVPARLARMKSDPLAPVVDEVPDLPRALEQLAKKL